LAGSVAINASLRKCESLASGSSAGILRVFYFLFFNKQMLLCFGHGWRRISHTLGTPLPKKSYHHSGPSPIRLNDLWIGLDNGATRAKAPGRQRGCCGPFEEEEEGIGIACDVVKVKCEDPATPGSSKGNKARSHVGDPFRGYVLLGLPNRNDAPISVT